MSILLTQDRSSDAVVSLPADDEDKVFVNFLESEIPEDNGEGRSYFPRNKMLKLENGTFGRIPLELFPHFLKFLSSEDLVSCSLVCRSLNCAASDESLWRRLVSSCFVLCVNHFSGMNLIAQWPSSRYSLRWGLSPPSKELSQVAWKKRYFQRDEEDVVKVVRNCPPEFKEYYTQMQASKRSQTPIASQVVNDDQTVDKTIADEVKVWKIRRGLDKLVEDHSCSGESCSFSKIGDAFICEKTGNVHVCDYTCREVVMDLTSQLLVCTISGHCYDGPASPSDLDSDNDKQQDGPTDEAETFNRLGQFYSFGYNCDDEKELEKLLWNISSKP